VKAVILTGGEGSRLSEETETKHKPMIDIGGKPVLWHIMKHYSVYESMTSSFASATKGS
jgi:glucose-1-phosphate cytidylyltransferase